MNETLHWHPAAELPEPYRSVLVYVPSVAIRQWRISIGFYTGAEWVNSDSVHYEAGSVRAWAELPEGPE